MQRALLTRRSLLAAAGGTALADLAGCAADRPPEERTIEMTDELTFEPASTTVALGGTVTWRTVGRVEHTVTAYEGRIPDGATYFASGEFDSEQAARRNISRGLIGKSEEYTHTFETPGRFEYFCIPHETAGMKGTIVVE